MTDAASKNAPSRAKLSRAKIVESALALVRAEGLQALTMRRVATELQAGAMSLYRHVADRDDLLLGMMDHVALSLVPPPAQPDPREEIVQIFLSLHREFRQDPWIVHVLLFEGRGSLKILPLFERIFTALAQLGCDPDQTIERYSLLMHYAYGESLAFQTKERRYKAHNDWRSAEFRAFPATKAILQRVDTWAYDEFERNIRRMVTSF